MALPHMVAARPRGTPLLPLSRTYLTYLSDTNNLVDHSYSNVDIGAEAADRAILLAVAMASQTPAAATVNGVALTLLDTHQSASGNRRVGMFLGLVPTGTLVTVVASTGGSASGQCSVGVYRLQNVQTIAAQSVGKAQASGGSALFSTTVNKVKDGATFAIVYTGTGGNPVSERASQLDSADATGATLSAQMNGGSNATWTGAVRDQRNTIQSGTNVDGVMMGVTVR